jgi:hypothetical protein
METLLTPSKHLRLYDVDQENIVGIPMNLLAAQPASTLMVKRMSYYSSCACSVITGLDWDLLYAASWVHTTKLIVATYNPAEECLAPFDGDARSKKSLRKHIV